MKTYRVTTTEIHEQDVLVLASSPEDAIERVSNGEGEQDMEGLSRFVERLDECWRARQGWRARLVESNELGGHKRPALEQSEGK